MGKSYVSFLSLSLLVWFNALLLIVTETVTHTDTAECGKMLFTTINGRYLGGEILSSCISLAINICILELNCTITYSNNFILKTRSNILVKIYKF